MSWYIHPTKQLRDDELPPELVVTNRNGSIEQVYVPYNASDQLQAENAKLRELVRDMWEYIYIGTAQDGQSLHDRTHSLGIEVDDA